MEQKVPVTVPCVKDKPEEVRPLRERILPDEWRALTTDQRENLLGAQALARKAFEEKLLAATAGC